MKRILLTAAILLVIGTMVYTQDAQPTSSQTKQNTERYYDQAK